MSQKVVVRFVIGVTFALGALASALAQMPNPYGTAISLENAKKAAAPALAEAAKNNWKVAVAIVGPAGTLIYYEKMDNTQLGSAEVAIDKARTAALFKRPTKAFQDALAAGGVRLRILTLKGVVAEAGGTAMVIDGTIMGGNRANCGAPETEASSDQAARETV